MKDSRAKRSLPGLPLLASTQLPMVSQPSVPRVSPCRSGGLAPSGNSPGFVKEHSCSWLCLDSDTGGSLVRNRLGFPIRVPTLFGKPQFGSQTGAWFPPAQRARSEGIVSVLPCLQTSRGIISLS
eukprot:1190632-Prorocentrum_minimum.AAC.1